VGEVEADVFELGTRSGRALLELSLR